MGNQFGSHTIDRFASALNTLLPQYNKKWLDPSCEAVDALHLSHAHWRDENPLASASRPSSLKN
jgi:hypothetical protein